MPVQMSHGSLPLVLKNCRLAAVVVVVVAAMVAAMVAACLFIMLCFITVRNIILLSFIRPHGQPACLYLEIGIGMDFILGGEGMS